MRDAKRLGISDRHLAERFGLSEVDVRRRRLAFGIVPVMKAVDTCGAEFEAETPYFYSTYEEESEVPASERRKVLIIGSGPNRIGQGLEFDYCCVQAALERFPLVHCEMGPGDALFFHGNLLHCSAQNTSDQPRWSLICCYNTRENDPYKEHHHPRYTPLAKVDDSMIKIVGARGAGADQTSFLDPARDRTTSAGKK